ncbi:MAG: hypothetical protein WC307_05075 [Candidatus Nanoarchaeia archaeon]|jgi:ribosomal protein L37AE/L43A
MTEEEYPIYKCLNNYECTKCKDHVSNETFSMVWKGEPYCPKCALGMKKSGEVKDRTVLVKETTSEELKTRRNEL